MYICQYCGKECKNKNSLAQHEIRCKENPNRIFSTGLYKYNVELKPTKRQAWNKGLTKETDERIKKYANTLKTRIANGEIIPSFTGKHHTEESKQKTSLTRKQYLAKHPEKTPYKLNHSSQVSYPERYFKLVFANENIDLKYHKQVSRYELDFYNDDKMIDVEIDGVTHLNPQVKKKDIERTSYLESLGWKVYRIVWSDYKKLSLEDRQKQIQYIKTLLLQDH